ncbi:carboxypeptidase regulatory-like domain-containing protein [Panacibacter sp. DH6]|uniref:Carboxypeptidase regulatory-like domain-containing protein n=1 Tax=Panacibacter microcysteis TaxID=2793269 RepID=A0A931E816_9BACT|nr:carboxypeptidase regulatory-like domain-containing protein [Panacibacter microcysteis]MBG9376985.1 carboxypeptidase regulatory-like domain-containing protein [Panacibacter microcysteis]
MKNTKLALLAMVSSAAMLFSFNGFQTKATLKGSVTPAEKATTAWAISSSDTLHADIKSGTFEFKDVTPGTYSVIIEAQEPYANTRKKDVVVAETEATTDVGEIKLQPK